MIHWSESCCLFLYIRVSDCETMARLWIGNSTNLLLLYILPSHRNAKIRSKTNEISEMVQQRRRKLNHFMGIVVPFMRCVHYEVVNLKILYILLRFLSLLIWQEILIVSS